MFTLNPDPIGGTPLLGLARDVAKHIPKTFWGSGNRWVTAPDYKNSNARHHGDFDNDAQTLLTTLARISGKAKSTIDAGVLEGAADSKARLRQSVAKAIAEPNRQI